MRNALLSAALCLALVAPSLGDKLDNSNSMGATTVKEEPTADVSGPGYFATKLPLTSAIVERDFAIDYSDIVTAIDTAITASTDETSRTTAMVDGVTRVAISYELKLLDAPGAALMEIVERQAEYVTSVMEGEGAAICAPVIFDGSRELIGRGLWDTYAPQIDATLAAFFSAVRLALETPSGIGQLTAEDGTAVVAQMTAQATRR